MGFLFKELYYLDILAETPGVAWEIKKFFLKIKFLKNTNFIIFFSQCYPQDTHEFPQKMSAQSVQPFGRL